MSKEKLESVIIKHANRIGLALLTQKYVCELAGVKAGSYGRIMGEKFTDTLYRMESNGLPRYVADVEIDYQPRRVKADVRKQLILEAALRLCKKKIWARLTRVEIAAEAGVCQSLIPHYFGTMQELRDNLQFEADRQGIPLIPQKRDNQ